MSQDIISTKFYDPNIAQIRSSTKRLDDKYPFLLMPVRLETRYMRVDRPVSGYDDAEEQEILVLMLELEYLFKHMKLIKGMEISQAKILADRIEEITGELKHEDRPWHLPYPENTWCESHKIAILSSHSSLNNTFKHLPENKKNQLQRVAEIMQEAASVIRGREIQKATTRDYNEAKRLIGKLRSIENIFNRIIKKPGNYTSKNKHQYFDYLERDTNLIEESCVAIEDMALKNIVAAPRQIECIYQFAVKFSYKLNSIKNVFSNIQSEFKKAEFLEKFDNSLKPKVDHLSNVIKEVISPKLKYLHKLKTVKATELLYQAKKIQFELELINDKGINTYNQLQTVRIRLYTLLRKFREKGHNIILGHDWQINQLRSAWSQVDNLLVTYTEMVGQLNGKDQYEDAGISRAISHINENYRADLGGLKRGYPENRAAIQNSDFSESANASRIAFNKMKELAGHLKAIENKQNLKKTELLQAIELLQEFSNEFAVLALKTTILPETYYKNILNIYKQLAFSVSKINNNASGNSTLVPQLPHLTDKKEEIAQSLKLLESDITDIKDRFYDDFRKKFIFSLKTETVDELWVRIYPDDIFVSSHEKAVTQEELEDTKYFWTEVWNAAQDKEIELAAWRALAVKYGQNRASYLYQSFNPESIQQQHPKPRRPFLGLKHHLPVIQKLFDKLIESGPITYPTLINQLPAIKNYLNTAINIINSIDAETVFLLNTISDLYQQVTLRLHTILSLVERMKDPDKGPSEPAHLLLSEVEIRITSMGEKLSKIKAVDITRLEATVVPNFPDNIKTKDNQWSKAPRSTVMPDRFVFLGMNGDKKFTHIKVGNVVPNPLIVGINPESTGDSTFEYDDKGNLMIDKDTKWLTDFDEAVKKGMGIIVPLKGTEKAEGFKKIIVIGVNDAGAETSKAMLEELLQSHAWSPEGMGILPLGTPTNNTEAKPSGFSSEEESDKTYERITGDSLFQGSPEDVRKMDGFRLTKALGIVSGIFNRLEHADGQDMYNALLMNKSMWNSTMGYYMEEVMDSIFTLDNIRRTQDYFTNYVSGRGWLPALRIGTQPYGILPTTAFSRFKAYPNEEIPPVKASDFANMNSSSLNQILQTRFDIRLKWLLNTIREQWMGIVKQEQLKIDDFDPSETTAQEHFMQLLGLQATSIEQYFRYNTNTAHRRSTDPTIGSSVNFTEDAIYGPYNMQTLFGQLVDNGYFIDDSYYEDLNRIKRSKTMSDAKFNEIVALSRIKESRIFRLRYHDNFGQLTGPFVSEYDGDFLKSEKGLTFIDMLLKSEPHLLWDASHFHNFYSNSLFYMFLRQSLALSYRDVALDLLMEDHAINENTRRRAGAKGNYLIPGPSENDIIFTKWDYLFRTAGELTDIMRKSPFKSFPLDKNWEQTSLINNTIDSQNTIADYLYNLPQDDSKRAKLTELKGYFMELKEIPVNKLERMFAEHLDLCTYRFDAWQLGLANKRLEKMRAEGNADKGIYLGAFGILEDLVPGGERDAVNVPDALKENDNKLVYKDKDNEGFIHTPSINHALTAAILRSGYIANKKTGDLNNPMAVNLTSKRVRMALKLMQGIHNGQETGALLGYQFERGLHENYLQQNIELDQFIYDLRKKFPLVPDADSESDINQNDEQSTMNVVNGLKMLDAVRDKIGENALMGEQSLYELELQHSGSLKTPLGLPASISSNQLHAIFKEIDEMANAFDALGDLLMSESVYHIAQGNHVRSAAVFAALSEGRTPKEVQIINTPRSGHILTQRLILQLEAVSGTGLSDADVQAKAQYWQNIGFTPRSLAEPSLNKWLGEMIGDPTTIRCYAEYTQDATTHTQLIRLSDLSLQAIDIIYTMSSAADDSSDALNKLLAYYVRTENNLPVGTEISIHFKDRNDQLIGPSETLSADIKTFNEVLPLFSSLFETISKGRFTAADDYLIPGDNIPSDMNLHQLDVDEIKSRATLALQNFVQIKDKLKAVFVTKGLNINNPAEIGGAIYSTAEINTMRDNLLATARFGIPNAQPDAAIETSAEAGAMLAKQAVAIIKVMEEKAKLSQSLLDNQDDLTDQSKVERFTELAKNLFGSSFVMIPHFSLRNRQHIHQILSLNKDEGLLRNTDEYAMDAWVEGIAKVRTKVNKLEMVNTMAEIFDNDFPEYTPIQLPFETVETADGETVNDYWLGMEYPADYEPENDKLSLVVLNTEALHADVAGAKCCGLLIDEWIEVIPEREETSGIAFNYDQPDAEPPQSMLLVVPPVETGKWKWDDLVYSILDTMDLYKARLVEPEQIDKSIFTQVLPAVMGEFPVNNHYRHANSISKLGMFDLRENNK
jgi:hypothetical protein